MAAMLTPGMRAVSITIATDSGAGGFILPNDRVDVILTRKFTQTDPPLVVSDTILSNVRVLAVDQTYKQDKDTRTVTAKSATLELTPGQAEAVAARPRPAPCHWRCALSAMTGEVASLEASSRRSKTIAAGGGHPLRHGARGKLVLQEKPQ